MRLSPLKRKVKPTEGSKLELADADDSFEMHHQGYNEDSIETETVTGRTYLLGNFVVLEHASSLDASISFDWMKRVERERP